MSDLELEPWEIGPLCKEHPEGSSQREHWGKKWRAVEMRRKKFVVFVRDVRAENRGNWIVTAMEGNQPRLWSPRPDIATSPPNVNWDYGVGRFFVWDDEMVFLNSNGDGAWLDAQLRAETSVRSTVPSITIEESSRKTFYWLTRELGDDSDFSFARRWRMFNSEEKLAALYGGQDCLYELRGIMRSVIVLDDYSWVRRTERRWEIAQNLIFGDLFSNKRAHYAWSAFIADWAQIILQWMISQMTVPIGNHPCIGQFSQTDGNCIAVEVSSPPTQHERLEARLRLREWLERNAPDEIERLLPK